MTIHCTPGSRGGGEVLEGGFGSQGQELQGGLKRDYALERRNGILAVGRDEFRDLVFGHALDAGS